MKQQHHTHALNPLIPQGSVRTPSFCELIEALTSEEIIRAADESGLGRTRESIYRHLDGEIFRIGTAHLDDPAPRDLYVLYEELAVELKEKYPHLNVPFHPALAREEVCDEQG